MGPCRMPRSKKAGEEAKRMGVCGATIDTVVARNFARKVAAGAAAHWDHAREVVETFIKAAKGEAQGFTIKDEVKLLEVALDFDVPTEGRSVRDIAVEIGEKALNNSAGRRESLVHKESTPEETGDLAQTGRRAPGHRPRGGRDHAPHPHGRGSGLQAPHAPSNPVRPRRRVGWLHDIDGPQDIIRHPCTRARQLQPRRAQGRPGECGRPRP